jgi:hypothetical protein
LEQKCPSSKDHYSRFARVTSAIKYIHENAKEDDEPHTYKPFNFILH